LYEGQSFLHTLGGRNVTVKKKILITGAGGNVGQYIALSLAEAGYEVIGIYRTVQPACADYQLIQEDLSKHKLELTGIDTIVHAAASLTGSAKKMIGDNLKATENLIEFAEERQVKRFLLLSTVSVYGNAGEEVSEKSQMVNPGSYGMSKYLSECLVRESFVPEKIIIQLPRMLGPFVNLQDTKESGFLTMAKRILCNEDVVCFAPEVSYNNYLHVKELSYFVKQILSCSEGPESRTMLIGAKERMKMIEILGIMKDEVGSKSRIIAKKTADLPKCSTIDISKAVKSGFSPGNAEYMLRRFMREMDAKYKEKQNLSID